MCGVYKCPVCKGRGLLPPGFYQLTPIPTVARLIDEECQSCDGRGIIIVPPPYPEIQKPELQNNNDV